MYLPIVYFEILEIRDISSGSVSSWWNEIWGKWRDVVGDVSWISTPRSWWMYWSSTDEGWGREDVSVGDVNLSIQHV